MARVTGSATNDGNECETLACVWPGAVRPLAICLVATLLALTPAIAQAVPMYTLDDLGTQVTRSGETVGFTFSLTEDKTVADLGVFDNDGDGLGEAHQVGLWDSGGALIASATIPAGGAAVLDGDFRFVAITPLILTTGQTYTLGAHYPTAIDALRVNATMSLASGVVYGQDVVPDPPGFLRPTEPGPFATGFFGPNVKFAATVPEPSSLALGLLSVSGLLLRRRRAG